MAAIDEDVSEQKSEQGTWTTVKPYRNGKAEWHPSSSSWSLMSGLTNIFFEVGGGWEKIFTRLVPKPDEAWLNILFFFLQSDINFHCEGASLLLF